LGRYAHPLFGNYFELTGISTEEGKDILAAISVDTLERFGDAFFPLSPSFSLART